MLAIVLAAPTHAQVPAGPELDALREELGDRLHDVHFAASFSGLIVLSDEVELSGARYAVDDGVGTELSAVAMPFHARASPWGEGAAGLHVEGVAGYGRATQAVDDLYGGGAPGLETAVAADWTTYGGLLGAGPAFRLAEGLDLAAIANLGVARISSDAAYAGPGAALGAALLDGVALNWDAWVVSAGGAVRLAWLRALGDRHRLEAVGRYDLRGSTTVATADDAQDFSSRLQLATLRSDLTGPTGLSAFAAPLGWRATAGYRRFLEGTLFGVRDVIQLGGALELGVGGRLPLLRTVRVNGSVFLGGALSGWSLGGGASF